MGSWCGGSDRDLEIAGGRTTKDFRIPAIQLFTRKVRIPGKRRLDALRRERHLPNAGAGRIEDGVGDRSRDHGDCRFACARGGHIRAIQQHDFDFRHGEAERKRVVVLQSIEVTLWSSQVTSSPSARLMPCSAPPSHWLRRPSGFEIGPASTLTTIRFTLICPLPDPLRLPRPSRRTILTFVGDARDAASGGDPRWLARGLGEGRASQFAVFAAAFTTSIIRCSLKWRKRNSTGSAFARAASSSMKDSCANVFCSRCGERSGPVQNGETTLCKSARSDLTVPAPWSAPPTWPAT